MQHCSRFPQGKIISSSFYGSNLQHEINGWKDFAFCFCCPLTLKYESFRDIIDIWSQKLVAILLEMSPMMSASMDANKGMTDTKQILPDAEIV